MSDFDLLESFVRETETYETKEIDPSAIHHGRRKRGR